MGGKIEVRRGDLFDPMEDERFDFIVSILLSAWETAESAGTILVRRKSDHKEIPGRGR